MVGRQINAEFGAIGISHRPKRRGLIVGNANELLTDDVFCGYRSNCDHAGFEVSHQCLELFRSLEVPFGVSVIVV